MGMIPMTDTDAALEQDESIDEQELQVFLWRFVQLRVHGYAERVASALAADLTVDLELARRLVSKLGCPPELAARIVA